MSITALKTYLTGIRILIHVKYLVDITRYPPREFFIHPNNNLGQYHLTTILQVRYFYLGWIGVGEYTISILV